MTRTEERAEQPAHAAAVNAADAVHAAGGVAVLDAPSRARPRISGARVATLVAGGTVVALVLAAAAIGGLVALGMAHLDDRRFQLPSDITAIEVHAEGLAVHVSGDDGDGPSGDGAPYAIVRGVSSSTLGPLPGIDIELRGTTAVITPDEPLRQLALGPYNLVIDLGDLVLDRIDIVTQGYVSVERVHAAEIHATSLQEMVYVRMGEASGLTLLEVASGRGPSIDLPESDGPYRVLLPEWFDDEYIEQWWRDHYGLDYRTEVLAPASWRQHYLDTVGGESAASGTDGASGSAPTPTPSPVLGRDGPLPIDGPGVFVPTDPDAAVTIDLRDAGGDLLRVVSPEAYERAGLR